MYKISCLTVTASLINLICDIYSVKFSSSFQYETSNWKLMRYEDKIFNKCVLFSLLKWHSNTYLAIRKNGGNNWILSLFQKCLKVNWPTSSSTTLTAFAPCPSVLPSGRGSSSRVPIGGLQARSDRDGAG